MKTDKEIEIDLKINCGTVISCPTEEEANQVLAVFHKCGLKWIEGGSFISQNLWSVHKEFTVYDPFSGNCATTLFYRSQGKNVITAQEFLKLHNNMNERNITLSLDKAREIYPTSTKEIKIILENTFPELLKPIYPNSHEELQELLIESKENISYIEESSFIYTIHIGKNTKDNHNISLSEKRAKEHLAFIQLIALRDYYNRIDDFVPDWQNGSIKKYVIYYAHNTIMLDWFVNNQYTLAFKSEKTRDLFYKNFKDLIEKCKEFI